MLKKHGEVIAKKPAKVTHVTIHANIKAYKTMIRYTWSKPAKAYAQKSFQGE
jgi:hypothetical protein